MLSGDDKIKWEIFMQSKMDLFYNNATWNLVQLLIVKKVLPSCKWVYKLKVTYNQSKTKYKARLVAKSSRQ